MVRLHVPMYRTIRSKISSGPAILLQCAGWKQEVLSLLNASPSSICEIVPACCTW